MRRILPYRTEDDRIVGVVITFNDVTDGKEHERALGRLAVELDERVRARTAEFEAANAALRKSEEWLSLAVHGTGMGTWDLDLRTGTGRWSKNHFEIMGYEAVSEGGATMEMWRSRIHPGDRERVARGLEEARRERSLFALEHRILRGPEGEPRWVSAQGRFFYAGDEAVRFVGVIQDITDRKRMEQTIAELAQDERKRLGRSEAAHNAARHAQTDEIVIRLEDRDGVHILIRDQGVGIRPEIARAVRGFGLDIMRHRCGLAGGILQIESPPEGGTLVHCFLPKGK